MEPIISLITLEVSDLTRSIGFYRDGLGLPLRPGEEAIAFFKTKGASLPLFPKESLTADANVHLLGSGSPGFTLTHDVRIKEEVDSLISHAVSVGATLVKPAQDAK